MDNIRATQPVHNRQTDRVLDVQELTLNSLITRLYSFMSQMMIIAPIGHGGGRQNVRLELVHDLSLNTAKRNETLLSHWFTHFIDCKLLHMIKDDLV